MEGKEEHQTEAWHGALFYIFYIYILFLIKLEPF